MASFSIGEVEQLTGIKAHVLRHWEELVPLLSPRKDGFGHRVYTSHDVQIIMRLHFLVVERKFTIAGAYEQILRETTEISSIQTLRQIKMMRDELIAVYKLVQEQREKKPDE